MVKDGGCLREVLSSSTVSSVQKLNEIYFHHYCEILAIASPSPSVIRKTQLSIIDLCNANGIKIRSCLV